MLRVERVSFAYPGESEIVRDVSLWVCPGERVLIMGPNGSGKSTLAKLAAGRIVPASGHVEADGRVGYVGQDPSAQFVSSIVGDEVAFGPRNLGLPAKEVRCRVARALRDCDLSGFERRGVYELSGGEKQRLALAGVLAMGCEYLVLDEITSELDYVARKHVRAVLDRLIAGGTGVLEITHHAREAAGASRVVRLGCNDRADTPLRRFSFEYLADRSGCFVQPASLVCSHLVAGYGKVAVLKDLTVVFPAGKVTLVVGPSGSGKSTLARVLAGVQKPMAGTVTLGQTTVRAGMVGLMFQRPGDELFADTVADEVAFGPRNLGVPEKDTERRVRWALNAVGLPVEIRNECPWKLSGGQRRRVALASVIAQEPGAYVFDEPTADLDAKGILSAKALAAGLARSGRPVVIVTHDVWEWRQLADGVVKLAARPKSFNHDIHARCDELPCNDDMPGTKDRSAHASLLAKRKAVVCNDADAGWLYRTDPLVKVACLVVLSVAACMASSRGLAILAVFLVVVAIAGGIGLRRLALSLRPVAVVILSALLVNALVVDGSYDLCIIGGVGLRMAGVVRGVLAVVRVVEIIGFSLVMSATTRLPDFVHAMARVFRPFGRLGFPVTDASVTLSLALQLIPEAITTTERIRCAQEARGASLRRGSPIRRLRLWISVLAPLIVEQFVRADDIAEAMYERGYTGYGMTDMGERAGTRDIALIGAAIIVLLISVAL